MPRPGIGYLFSTGLLCCLLAGCGGGDPSDHGDDGIACGYFIERGSYALANLQVADFASETTRTSPRAYTLRIDDVRLFGAGR